MFIDNGMSMKNNVKKKVVLWGTGNMASSIMKYYPRIEVEFFVDSYSENKEFFGKKVLRPENVTSWEAYFVVVALQAYEQVKTYLENKGCAEDIDFCDYKKYLGIENRSLQETLDCIKSFVVKNPEWIGANFIGGHILIGRNPDMHIHFFSEYVKEHKEEKHICVAHTSCLDELRASELLNMPFFGLPDITNWQGYEREKIDVSKETIELSLYSLSEEEMAYVIALQELYPIQNKEKSVEICSLIMIFYREMIKILRPSTILIGTDIKPEYRILYYYSQKFHIPALYWEYGWVPGTIMFLQEGTAGRSRIANNKKYYDELVNEYSEEQILEVKRYIRENKTDTNTFKKTGADQKELSKLDHDKKTVFLVGQGIEANVVAGGDFWKKNISSTFDSMNDILRELVRICGSNNYNLIYKPHPGLSTFVSMNDDKYDDVAMVRDAAVDELIEMSDVVVSLYSAVDCKALLYSKPLITIGKSIVTNAQCTYYVEEREMLEHMVNMAMVCGFTKEQEENYNLLLGKCLSNILWDDMNKSEISFGLPIKRNFFDMVRGAE